MDLDNLLVCLGDMIKARRALVKMNRDWVLARVDLEHGW